MSFALQSPYGPIEEEHGMSLQTLLETVMANYAEMVTPGSPLAAGPERMKFDDLFTRICEDLKASDAVKAFPEVVLDWSIGKGTWAETPWVGLFDKRETIKPHKGFYVVFLFRRDMSGVYLAINEGVTEVDHDSEGGSRGINMLLARSAEHRPKFARLSRYGFSVDGNTDLRAKARGRRYQASVVAYKLYERSHVPSDVQLHTDIQHILDGLTRYVENRLEEDEEPLRAPRSLRVGVGDHIQWRDVLTRGYSAEDLKEITDLILSETVELLDPSIVGRDASRHYRIGEGQNLADEIGLLRDAQPGDKILATRGTVEILAEGVVQKPVYQLVDGLHTVSVKWDTSKARHVARQRDWTDSYVSLVSDRLNQLLMDPVKPKLDLKQIVSQFGQVLKDSYLSFGDQHEELVRSFVSALATKRLAILTGLSGSGKTQIALRLGEWLGPGQSLLIPVRPDWTGSEALFGYVDGLVPPASDGRRTWFVPKPLEFMLKAAHDPANPYLLILDEMNLAHVERYFADVLSGIESDEPCLPNLIQEGGVWRDAPEDLPMIPLPDNLFIVGTVNVDETTYMFSPKVLDRANTFEFRVMFDDLSSNARKPGRCRPGDLALTRGFLAIASDQNYHLDHPVSDPKALAESLRPLHLILSGANLEFGHRLFYEAIRFAALMQMAGAAPDHILDRLVMQKILPRVHGTRRRLEDTLRALGRFCFDLTHDEKAVQFDPEKPPKEGKIRLPRSFDKVQRMMRGLWANQFTSFVE